MSWILGIDTSSTDCSIGLIHENKPVISCSRYIPNSHAEHISYAIKYVLEAGGIDTSDITHTGISVGPGSFTGLRIGISFLKGFFLSRASLILPVSSLQIMAEAFNGSDGAIVSAMDARRDKVFYAEFTKKNSITTRIKNDVLISKGAFLEMICDNHTVLADTIGYKKSTAFKSLDGKGNILYTDRLCLQRGLAAANIASQKTGEESLWKKPIDILPNYMLESYLKKSGKR
jgi:tRNA threonylcarbamoyl adenosine modification protein YeaZ